MLLLLSVSTIINQPMKRRRSEHTCASYRRSWHDLALARPTPNHRIVIGTLFRNDAKMRFLCLFEYLTSWSQPSPPSTSPPRARLPPSSFEGDNSSL